MKYIIALVLSLFLSSPVWAGIVEEKIEYKDASATLEGFLVYDDALRAKRPGVLVFHEWWGLNDHVKTAARKLASLGYVAFAPDVYGKGVRPSDREAAGKESGKYMKDRTLLRSRALAGLNALKMNGRVDTEKIAATGYCFGGAAALELGRSGAPVSAIVTFHGALNTPTPEDARHIKGSVLVLHGGADPFVKPTEVQAFQESMEASGVDWQLISYGGAVHGFTNPTNGADPSDGLAYQEKADRRSWEAMKDFLEERLGKVR
ncbi:MAG: dienelactone hydrolase family protein [Deltaproteobacteria bacterium]|nr:dienelactone hydrolase family protein [Deltaproteobacteria bacterium]